MSATSTPAELHDVIWLPLDERSEYPASTMRRDHSILGPIAACVLVAAPFLSSGCFDLSTVSRSNTHLASNVDDWRDEVIYQVVVDRFADSVPGNNWRVDHNSLARYQGGDWQGVIDHLDYITALGVTTLWISPIVRNVDNDAGIDGYHGYWASDLAELNAHFGDLATLRRLVQECHTRHLRVVLDIVTNHMGQMFYYDMNQNGRADDQVYGGGPNAPQNPGGMGSEISRITEFDPDYNPRGVQSFTSLGPAGPAPVIFLNMPDIFRTAPRSDRACPDDLDSVDADGCNDWQRILARPEGYHRRGRIVNYNSPMGEHQPTEQVMTGDFPGGLKDVATERPDVRRAMIEAYVRWVRLLDLDGFRIDTLKHVEHEFWSTFAPAVRTRLARIGKRNFFMFGEAFDGDDELLGSYTRENEMDSVFYFSQKYRIFQNIFQCEQGTNALESLAADRATHYNSRPQPGGANAAPNQLLVNFFDNHDVARFLAGVLEDGASCSQGRVTDEPSFQRMRTRMRAALVYLFTEDGIPCVYYGTEQDFRGGNDPSNRERLWDSNYRTDGDTFQHVARLTRIRRAYPALRRGGMQLRWTTMRTGTEQDAGMLAFERRDGTDAALVVINAHSGGASETSATSMPMGGPMTTGFAPGTQLVDVLARDNPLALTVGAGGALTVRLEPWQSVILVPRDQVRTLPP